MEHVPVAEAGYRAVDPECMNAEPSGLKRGILSPTETLAQSISTIAPTTTPAMTIPLVFAQAANGTWLSYGFALAAILLIAFCIASFARQTSSCGSLYSYATSLPPFASGIAGWALLFAYGATGASVTGGFLNYSLVLLADLTGKQLTGIALPIAIVTVAVVATTLIAYRDVQVSTRLMLWVEAASVLTIVAILVLLVAKTGVPVDRSQLHLVGVKPTSVRLGVVLAIFSFVGFESATSLGVEARNPLRTIPRAVVQSALYPGLFFVLCAYLETYGMARAHANLGTAGAPFHVLAELVGVPLFGTIVDIGALVSMFACTLACTTAAGRVLLRMAQNGLAHRRLASTHSENATPHLAVLAVGLCTLVPVALLTARGVSGLDIYGWLGSLAVYGFLTAYGLAVIALPVYLRRRKTLTTGTLLLAGAATLAIIAALAGTLYPVPTERPYNWLPYVYLVYLAAGLVWQTFAKRRLTAYAG